jgi:hypothetical protein
MYHPVQNVMTEHFDEIYHLKHHPEATNIIEILYRSVLLRDDV